MRYKKEIPAEAAQMVEELTECANVIADRDKRWGKSVNRIERCSEAVTRVCRQSDCIGLSIGTKSDC